MPKYELMTGVQEVLSNMHERTRGLAVGFETGIKAAARHLLRESQKMVPVETGKLKDSGYVRSKRSGFRTDATVGYSAPYALAVHEKVGMVLKGLPRHGGVVDTRGRGSAVRGPGGRFIAGGRYWDPQDQAQAKFLEEPSRREASLMRQIVQAHMRIK